MIRYLLDTNICIYVAKRKPQSVLSRLRELKPGDVMSDALAAQVGGLGMAPGANIGDQAAVFEATHGTAPKYANKDMVNPGSLILSGAMMFDYLGWNEAGKRIKKSLEKTISKKTVTYDLARQMKGAKRLKCSQFASAIIENL